MSAENRRLTPEEEAAELAKPGSHPEWEIDLPADLQKAIDDYLEGIRAQVTYLDCLADELYGSINANQWAGKSPKNRRITCGPSTSSSRRRRKQKIFGRPNHETQRCCPTKPDSGFFVPSSRDRESRCWPPCGPVRRFSPQGGETTRSKPAKAKFGTHKGKVEKSPDKSTGRGEKE